MKYPRRKDQYNCDLMCENFHEIDHRLHALEEGGGGHGGGSGSFEEIYEADYEKLSEEEKNDENMLYFLPDGDVEDDGGVDVGDTDISGIGDGTITGAIGALDEGLDSLESISIVNRGTLTSDDDLNSIFTPGMYQYATASVPQNCPFANAGIVEVIKSQSKYIQRVTRYGVAGQSAERLCNGTTSDKWLAWTTRCAPVNLAKIADITASANTYTKVTTVSIPAKSFYTFTAFPIWYNYCPMGVRICSSDNVNQALAWQEQSSTAPYMVSATVSGYADKATTYYVYAKWNGGGAEQLHIQGFYIPSV